MINPIARKWRKWQLERQFRKQTADLPDHILRDIGLERDQAGLRVMRNVLPSCH